MSGESFKHIEAVRAYVDRLCELAFAGRDLELAAKRREVGAVLDRLAAAATATQAERDGARKTANETESQLAHLRQLLERGPDGYIVTDRAGIILDANHAAADLLGLAVRFLIRKPLSLFVDETDLRAFRWRLNDAHAQDRGEWPLRIRPRRGPPFTAGVTVTTLDPRPAEAADLRWFLRDISARQRAEQLAAAHEFTKEVLESEQRSRAAAESAQRRLEVLANVSRVLAGSLDCTLAFSDAAGIIVPGVADLFVADLLAGDALERVTVACADAAAAEHLRSRCRPPADLSGDHPIAAALRWTAEPVLVTATTPAWLATWAESEDALAVWQEIGLSSAAIVPITSHRQTHGVLTFGWAAGRQYDPADVGLMREIGLRAALALDASRLINDLESEQRHRDEFLAMLAHELRNPLAAITTGLDVLERTAPSERAHLTDIIARQSRHLAQLLNDLLQVSRVRFGQVTLHRKLVDLRELAQHSLDAVQPPGAQVERPTVTLRADPKPVRVLGDPDRLEQVIDNLLDNALKYTPSGGAIEVSVTAEGNEAILRVRDTGIGISPDFLPRVFDVFSRSGSPTSQSRPGLGLGLSVVRDLIANHGGRVQVSSPGVGRGSEFVVRLPLVSAEPASGVAEAPAPAAVTSILVVEDNDDAREALRMALELNGQRVRTAGDGAHAIAEARECPPDTAVIDIGLPDTDGYQVARAIRAQPGGDRVHLIALTGYGQSTDRERALGAGFDSWLVKPVDPSVLLGVIAKGRAPASVTNSPPRG
jgi:PAS domain S-box-containing protein